MFTTLIVQPIFNVLVAIYALIPGHNFGLAIVLFTILARIALYPLLKKQLKNTKAMRELQPDLKRIKKESKGDKQRESAMMMELYKEKEIKPLSQIGLLVVQLVVFLALFSGLNRIVKDPNTLLTFSYEPIRNTAHMQELSSDITKFDNTLLGGIDLSRPAYDQAKGLYMPAFLMVLGSAIVSFYQIKQTMPNDKDGRKLRDILREANAKGEPADTSELNAAMGRSLAYFMPGLIFILTIGFPAALALYWFVGGVIAYAQQTKLLQSDEFAMQEASAVVVSKKTLQPSKPSSKDSKNSKTDAVKTTVTIKSTNKSSKSSKTNKTNKSSKTSKSTKKRRR